MSNMADDKRVPIIEIQTSVKKYGHTINGKLKEKKDTDTVIITKDDKIKASKKCSDVKSLKQKISHIQ